MQVKLTPKTSYEVEIDGVKIPGTFVDDGKWNGMQCVKGEPGKIIFTVEPINIMSLALVHDGSKEGQLVSASPCVLGMLPGK